MYLWVEVSLTPLHQNKSLVSSTPAPTSPREANFSALHRDTHDSLPVQMDFHEDSNSGFESDSSASPFSTKVAYQRIDKKQSLHVPSSARNLISVLETKDSYTAGHADRVARAAVLIANRLGLDREQLETVYLAGLLHDIGKIGIDAQLLNKPDKLTAKEFEQIKQHPQLGYTILQGMPKLEKTMPIVLHHHEAWDGSGYPDGLQGTDIPLLARILSVADSYDAMASNRSYQRNLSPERLDDILRDGAGLQWDPQVIEAFFEIRDIICKVNAL